MSPSPTALILIPHYPHQLFTYVIPDALQQTVCSGHMVLVPFGPNVHVGLVTETMETTETTGLRPIKQVVDGSFELSPSMLSLARWMASYYLTPVGVCLQLMLPPMFKHGMKERVIITPLGRMMAAGSGRGRPIQHAILTRLQSAKQGLTQQYLRQQLGHRRIAPALTALKKNGHIESHMKFPLITQHTDRSNRGRTKQTPTDAVIDIAHGLLPDSPLPSPLALSIRKSRSQTFIMQAPPEYRTGVYLKAIQETIKKRRSCIVTFPHASQARAFSSALRPYLGDHISDWFGTRAPARRTSDWYRVQSGEAKVVIGTRSSVLSPASKLGLIIVDEDHDPRHKVDHNPRFHTREIGLTRANKEAATVILGSLHPSVEAIHMAKSKKAVVVTAPPTPQLTRVLTTQQQASVQCIDMKTAPREGRIFSAPLVNAVATRVKNREPVILFQPRRGFSRSLWCRDCGHTTRCTHCSVALTYYKREHKMLCHICGESHEAPHICSACAGTHVLPMGFGTEGVEEAIRSLFPDASIVRMDRDLVRSEAAALSFMNRLDWTKLDILIGTSMLLDIVPIPRVSLVGIISADTMLHMPDFRAAERAFHQLMALKAFVTDGEMFIQAVNTEHPMLQAVTGQDPHRYYADELAIRAQLSFPPFTRLVCARVTGETEGRVQQITAQWAAQLRKSQNTGIQEVLGPIPAPYARIRGRHRYHILIKEPRSGLAAELAHSAIADSVKMMNTLTRGPDLTFEVDVDPQVFL